VIQSIELNSEPHGRERFENERWALEQLKALALPAVPTLIASGRLEERPYIVMTFAQGENLRVVSARQRKQLETMGQVRALLIAERILDALSHIHDLNICHRDVKDANVVIDSAPDDDNLKVTLLDFGMCKGWGQPADAETFFGAGSSRFSPPSKLVYPAEAVPNHDVFAVGVLGYLLLTNYFPWDHPPQADTGKLRDLMLTVVPPRIQQLNNKVRREVSEVFSMLLDTDDSRRPSAKQALKLVKEAKTRMETVAEGIGMPHNIGLHLPRVIRDPIHSDINMSAFEWRLLNTAEVQRLRWIRQLGTSHLVFPGAEHSRLSHALGTMYVASEIVRRYEERTGISFDADERQMARAYALLHDVSHIAYGHSLEDEMRIFTRHDHNEARIERLVESDNSELGRILSSSNLGKEVVALFGRGDNPNKRTWITELVEAPCGADVLDYIDRDAYHCGLDHRVDSAIYRRFSIDRSHVRADLYGPHGVRLDASFALESILRERLALYLKVYAHPVKVAAGAMIGKAVATMVANRRKNRLDESKIEWMGDGELLQFLRNSGCPLAKKLAEMVVGTGGRHVWKPAFGARVLREGERDQAHYRDRVSQLEQKAWFDLVGRANLEAKMAQKANCSADDLIFYCPGKAPGLQRIRQYVGLDPTTTELHRDEEPYRRIYEGHLKLWTVYVFVPPNSDRDTFSRVARAASEVLELQNEVDLRPKQLSLFLPEFV